MTGHATHRHPLGACAVTSVQPAGGDRLRILRWSLWKFTGVVLVLLLFGRPALGLESQGETVVITQKDLDAQARKRAEAVQPQMPGSSAAAGFGDEYSYPFRECYYWHWLETGQLSVVAQIEEEIGRLVEKARQTNRSRLWSEQLQRELDVIEDDIDRLEEKRDQAIAERIAALELSPSLSSEKGNELGVLYMALALLDLDAGKAKTALESLARAGKVLPDEPLVDLLRGIALREAGENDEAARALEQALSSEPRMLMALITLARLHEDELDYGGAAKLWKRAGEVRLGFPRGLGRWADRNRRRYPEGEESLRRVWADYLQSRLRWARLRDFAHRYYQSFEKPDFDLVYDPSIGVPLDSEAVAELHGVVTRYVEQGEEAVRPGEVEHVFGRLNAERESEVFGEVVSYVTDSLVTARRDIADEIGYRPRRPVTVVLYNPAVWETLIASRSTLGVYRPLGRSINVYVSPETSRSDLRDTIYHEYGHFVTLQLAGPRRLPLWLAEGLAEAMALGSGRDRYADDPYLARWSRVWAKDPISREWFGKGPESFGMADYYKARRAVGLLVSRFGWDGVGDFLEALGNGADLAEASQKAFDMNYRELQRFVVKRLPSWTGP